MADQDDNRKIKVRRTPPPKPPRLLMHYQQEDDKFDETEVSFSNNSKDVNGLSPASLSTDPSTGKPDSELHTNNISEDILEDENHSLKVHLQRTDTNKLTMTQPPFVPPRPARLNKNLGLFAYLSSFPMHVKPRAVESKYHTIPERRASTRKRTMQTNVSNDMNKRMCFAYPAHFNSTTMLKEQPPSVLPSLTPSNISCSRTEVSLTSEKQIAKQLESSLYRRNSYPITSFTTSPETFIYVNSNKGTHTFKTNNMCKIQSLPELSGSSDKSNRKLARRRYSSSDVIKLRKCHHSASLTLKRTISCPRQSLTRNKSPLVNSDGKNDDLKPNSIAIKSTPSKLAVNSTKNTDSTNSAKKELLSVDSLAKSLLSAKRTAAHLSLLNVNSMNGTHWSAHNNSALFKLGTNAVPQNCELTEVKRRNRTLRTANSLQTVYTNSTGTKNYYNTRSWSQLCTYPLPTSLQTQKTFLCHRCKTAKSTGHLDNSAGQYVNNNGQLKEIGKRLHSLHLSKEKLESASKTSELFAAFAMIALVEMQINMPCTVPDVAWALFAINTSIVVGVNILALMITTYVLPNVSVVTKLHPNALIDESAHERMRRIIELAWCFTTFFGLSLFFVEVALICWVKFWDLAVAGAIASTAIVVPTLALFVYMALYFYRTLETNYEQNCGTNSDERYTEEDSSILTAIGLRWRRLHVSLAKLEATSSTSDLIAGFATMAVVELQTNSPTLCQPWLFILLAVNTTVLVLVHVFALMFSTFIQPSVRAVKPQRLIDLSPHDRLRCFIELAWALSTGLGVLLFLLEVGILCWIKFWDFTYTGALASSIIILLALALFVGFALYFYHVLVVHECEISTHDLQTLETLKRNLDVITESRGIDNPAFIPDIQVMHVDDTD